MTTAQISLEQLKNIRHGKTCPYCLDATVIAAHPTPSVIKKIYTCESCKAWVGIHADGRSMGRLANEELRKWRIQAHYWFDPVAIGGLIEKIWPDKITGISKRNKAYLWLSKQLGIAKADCHIGYFDVDDCKKVVAICEPAVKRFMKEDDFLPY